MNLKQARELPVIAYLPFQPGDPGFALPLLAHPENPDLRVIQEVDEFCNLVSGYKVLEDFGATAVQMLDGPLAKVGGDVIHVFLTEDGVAHAGTLQELDATMKAFVSRCPDRTAIVLQIVELIGTDQEKRVARAGMRECIVRSTGASAAQAFYEGATLRSALWKRLLSHAPDAEAARRILSVRSRLSAHVDSEGSIKLDLSALDPRDRASVDEEKLEMELLTEFDVAPASTPRLRWHVDIKVTSAVQVGGVSDVLQKVRQTGRQEERIAILADAILQDRDTGVSVLIQYKDRAKTANWALHELHAMLVANKNERIVDEHVIAELIPRLFTKQYPLSRGDLLYYLAKHLAKWPAVNDAIQRSLDRTVSVFVDTQREQIQRILTENRRKHIVSRE